MLPNVKIKPVTSANSITGSRAYTFLDSYIYMKNQRYNALYEKNKEILAIENNAMSLKSASTLYSAFIEQSRILDSIVMRIRNFSLRIKPDIIENINILVPSKSAIEDFTYAISNIPDIPRMKYVKYDITPIVYEDMASFMNLYKREIKYFTDLKTQSLSRENPFIRDTATKYLIDTAMKHANVSTELLEMENIKVTTNAKLKSISVFFKHKANFVTTVQRDFKTFQFYLRQYSALRDIVNGMKPTELRDGNVVLSYSNNQISFNDYFVLYKHFVDMIKYMIKIISYHEQQFFNKIYALQGNIESYSNIINDVLDYKDKVESMKEDDSLNESVDVNELGTPELIQKYMEKNIKYDSSSNWKLRSPQDTMNDLKGNCHDQSLLSIYLLNRIDKKCGQLFYIEYNDYEESGGRTHTLTWYNTRGKIYWMENAWGSQKGIHGPYDDISSLKKAIKEIHSKEPESKRYPKLEFSIPKNIRTGYNLSEYVNACLTDSLNEAYYDGYMNSDEIDAHNLINGNYAAHLLLNDNAEDETPIEKDVFTSGQFSQYRKDDISENYLDAEDEIQLTPDTIDGVKEEVISNFNEYEESPKEGGVTICTMRDSLNF